MQVELLAPAGDLERLKIAIKYGADAVYIGYEKLSLRANATNFTFEEILEGVNFAHGLGKKVYVTVNIVMHNQDLLEIESSIKKLSEIGVDALIISDPAIFKYAQKYNLEIHLSTQASTMNYKSALFFKKQGVKRIVLARECSRNDIKEIIEKTNMDIETFIHGAMCAGISGRCVMSNYVTLRDSNRGGCSQVCRFNFKTDSDDFTMATKDLNLARYIKDLIDINVRSLKVEGRMRSIYYLATVIGTYRKIIDAIYGNYLTDEFLNEQEKILSRVANRETSSHYLVKEADYNDQYYTGRNESSNQDYLGQVINYDKKNKLIKIYERNYFKIGDKVELFTPKGEVIPFVVEKLLDEDKNDIDIARHPDDIYYIFLDTDREIEEYSMIRLIEKSKK